MRLTRRFVCLAMAGLLPWRALHRVRGFEVTIVQDELTGHALTDEFGASITAEDEYAHTVAA